MTRNHREILCLAEAEGLEYLGATHGGKHTHLRFRNAAGAVLRMFINEGSALIQRNPRSKLNVRADFRRFARGEYHHLVVEGV